MKKSLLSMSLLSLVLTGLASGAALAAQNFIQPDDPGPATNPTPVRTTDPGPTKTGSVEILTDTQGVDFGPYLSALVPKVRASWYSLIPEAAQLKKGKLAIEFTVKKDGSIVSMKLAASSGDVLLDRPAWGAITALNPLLPLPSEFKGDYLSLRFRFYYNPDPPVPEGIGTQPDTKLPLPPGVPSLISYSVSPINAPVAAHAFMPAILMAHTAEAHMPKYPSQARKEKLEGPVEVTALVRADGTIENVTAVSGAQILADAAIHAIRSWHFYPAQRDSEHIEDTVRIRVDFRLSEKQVHFQVLTSKSKAAGNPVP